MWNLTKLGVGILGAITSGTIDPSGWAGGTCAEFFKHGRYEILNRTNEYLNDREANLRLIQLADSYQNASLGGNVTKTIGKLIKKEDKLQVLLDFGIDWVRGAVMEKGAKILLESGIKSLLTQITLEKSQNGLKNPLGLNLVYHYLVLTKKETNPEVREWAKGIIDLVVIFPRETTYENEVEVIIETLKIHEQNISSMLKLPYLVIAERKLIWQINEENVGLYIKTESNWDKHREANDLVNSCLRKLRERSGDSPPPSGSAIASYRFENADYFSFLKRLKLFLLEHEDQFTSEDKRKMERILSACIDLADEKQESPQETRQEQESRSFSYQTQPSSRQFAYY